MRIRTLWISDHLLPLVIKHSHNYYQLIYCQRGEGEVEINGTHHPMTKGEALLIKPMEEHSLLPRSGMRAIEIKFTVEPEAYEKSLAALPSSINIDGSASLSRSFRETVREGVSGADFGHEATNAALALFLIRLLREHHAKPGEHSEQSILLDDVAAGRYRPRERDADFLRIVNHIENHFTDELMLDDLCEMAGLERSYFITRFRRTFGIPPMRYVNAMRIEQSKMLLSTTDKSITEIALAVGFGGIHYFCRIFKRSTGVSPLAYREQNRQKA